MKVALVGKPGLVAHIGDIIPGPQARFGELNPRDIDKAGGRQAGILLEGADQRIFAQRKLIGEAIQRRRRLQIGCQTTEQTRAGLAKRHRRERAQRQVAQEPGDAGG